MYNCCVDTQVRKCQLINMVFRCLALCQFLFKHNIPFSLLSENTRLNREKATKRKTKGDIFCKLPFFFKFFLIVLINFHSLYYLPLCFKTDKFLLGRDQLSQDHHSIFFSIIHFTLHILSSVCVCVFVLFLGKSIISRSLTSQKYSQYKW